MHMAELQMHPDSLDLRYVCLLENLSGASAALVLQSVDFSRFLWLLFNVITVI